MLRSLSIRDFVIVEALELELDARLHRADRRDRRGQVDPGRCARAAARRPRRAAAAAPAPSAPSSRRGSTSPSARPRAHGSPQRSSRRRRRSCCSAACSTRGAAAARGSTARRRRSRSSRTLGEMLVEIHGQHAHQMLDRAEAQRALVDASAGSPRSARPRPLARLARDDERRDAARAAPATAAERESWSRASARSRRSTCASEWAALSSGAIAPRQRRVADQAATQARARLRDLRRRATRALAQLGGEGCARPAAHDPALAEVAALVEPRSSSWTRRRAPRDNRRRLDLDPAELDRIDERLRRCTTSRASTASSPTRSPASSPRPRPARGARRVADVDALTQRKAEAEAAFARSRSKLSAKRRFAATSSTHRVTRRCDARDGRRPPRDRARRARHARRARPRRARVPHRAPREAAVGPLARVASGGELSRIGLAIRSRRATSGRCRRSCSTRSTPASAAPSPRLSALMQSLGARRQVLCVTHLPQVASFADHHFRVDQASGGRRGTAERRRALDRDGARRRDRAHAAGGDHREDARPRQGALRPHRRTAPDLGLGCLLERGDRPAGALRRDGPPFGRRLRRARGE